jgi:hypothetical protein
MASRASASEILRLQRSVGNRAVVALLSGRGPVRSAGRRKIQRRLTFTEGPRAKVLDLTRVVTHGRDYGTTPAIINGREFPPGATPGAVNGPNLTLTPVAGGATQVTVQAEPTNQMGYRMELPTPPKWQNPKVRGDLVKSYLTGRLDVDMSAIDTEDEMPLRVAGLPDDSTFAKLVEVHENHHVRETKETYEEILVPWDKQIKDYQQAGGFVARAGEDPTAMFYSLVGGTPDEISKRVVDTLKERGDDFHATPKGKEPSVVSVKMPKSGLFGNPLTLYSQHP